MKAAPDDALAWARLARDPAGAGRHARGQPGRRAGGGARPEQRAGAGRSRASRRLARLDVRGGEGGVRRGRSRSTRPTRRRTSAWASRPSGTGARRRPAADRAGGGARPGQRAAAHLSRAGLHAGAPGEGRGRRARHGGAARPERPDPLVLRRAAQGPGQPPRPGVGRRRAGDGAERGPRGLPVPEPPRPGRGQPRRRPGPDLHRPRLRGLRPERGGAGAGAGPPERGHAPLPRRHLPRPAALRVGAGERAAPGPAPPAALGRAAAAVLELRQPRPGTAAAVRDRLQRVHQPAPGRRAAAAG